jgi:hypothetical protein
MPGAEFCRRHKIAVSPSLAGHDRVPICGRAGIQEARMTEGTTLDELLDDPIIQLVMASDHVEAGEVRELFDRARYRMDARAFIPAAHVIDGICKNRGMCA